MDGDLTKLVTITGRLFVASYFLWSAWQNVANLDRNTQDLTRAGFSKLQPVIVIVGSIYMVFASLLFAWPGTVLVGGIGLIVFTAAADAVFHRWWIYEEASERIAHKQLAFEHLALSGGIAGLIVASIHTWV